MRATVFAAAFFTVAIVTAASFTLIAEAQWAGLENQSAAVDTARYDFGTETGSNKNYYDGDMGDYDGDGRIDRAVISRYGLLWNLGGGVMVPVSTQLRSDQPPNSSESLTGYLFGDEVSIGNDAVNWVDLDGDGDLDVVQGGNGEPLVVQENRGARFSTLGRYSGSAVQIINIDLERDGDADLIVACWFPSGPDDFSVLVNDGSGRFTEEAGARGLGLAGNQIIGIAAGDLDDDRDFDLIVLSRAASQYWVYSNDGAGRFTRTAQIPVGGRVNLGSGFSQGMNLGDIDGDGDLDVVYAADDYVGTNPTVGHVILIGDGAGGFTEDDSRFDTSAYSFIGRLVAGNGKLVDIDYDGDLDFLAHTDLAGPPLNFQMFLNDGAGNFSYTRAFSPAFGVAVTGSVGVDVDIADLNSDGSYDVWIGIGGGLVTQLHNTYRDPSGLPADVPRNLRVVSATSAGVRIGWEPPPFAATARHYVVYRSLAQGLEARDRVVLRQVANSVFEDEGFSAPILAQTTTAYLGDPDVTLDAGRVELLDRTAVPGVTYRYSVAHVGTENARSTPTAEVSAAVPAPAGADDVGPEVAIVSPDAEWWSAYPRIVVTHADDRSGVDPSRVQVTLSVAAGTAAAGTDLAPEALVRRNGVTLIALGPDRELPMGPVDLTARVADLAGNVTTVTRRFTVGVVPNTPPDVSMTIEPRLGQAPLSVGFMGWGTDPDGEIVRWEWYFGDGETSIGSTTRHVYRAEGEYTVTLVARDHTGAVGTETSAVTVTPCTGTCAPADAGADGSYPDAAGDGGIDRIPARSGGCGCRAAGSPPLEALWWLAPFALLSVRRRRF